ncbi:hypothetical protein C8Q76DRAFT_692026 [Earliella scabrosa]|nr:hypothetical protein C8Q76DRAFT_692026 [Earliella scabrosa]
MSLPRVPRNTTEWSDAFRKATPVQCVTIIGTPPHGDFTVRLGDFVIVKPSGNRRDDAVLTHQVYYARISNLAVHSFYGSLVKLHWFFLKDELWKYKMRNLFAKRFLESASHRELLSIEHDSYDFADAINAVVPVISFNEHTISLPVISSDTLYWRSNHSFLRGRNPEELIQPFSCSIWFHEKCLERDKDATMPTLPPPLSSRPFQPTDPKQALDWHNAGEERFGPGNYQAWLRCIGWPIVRGSRDNREGPTHSFEMLVKAIREQQSAHGCPENVPDFVMANLHVAPHLRNDNAYYMGLFLNARDHEYYTCRVCQDVI